jgi:hypothetical protein
VLRELPGREPAALGSAPRARRRALLDTLRAYRDRGDFPHNYDFPGRAVPYFVDRGTSTLCAVAYLLAASGGATWWTAWRAPTTTCGCPRSPPTRPSPGGWTRRG